MASGDPLDKEGYVLLDAKAATDDGVWVDMRKARSSSVHVSGITTATVKVCASNAKLKPANNTNGVQIGSDVTADSMVNFGYPVRWMKARISAYTSGTISALAHGLS